PFPALLDMSLVGRTAQGKELLLALDQVSDMTGGGTAPEIVRKGYGLGTFLLRSKARLAHRQFFQGPRKDSQVAARERIVERKKNVARLAMIPVANIYGCHDPATWMLDGLDVRFDRDMASRNHGARQLGRRSPGAETAHEQRDRCSADRKMATQGQIIERRRDPGFTLRGPERQQP